MTIPDRKDRHRMGASRDFTTGTETGSRGSTAVLDRDQRSRREQSNRRTDLRPPERESLPTRTPGRDPHAPLPQRRRPYQNRLGSQQVVSVRGRRVATRKQTTLLAKLSGVAIVLLVSGVAMAMWLSGASTQQTFQMQQLASQENQLSNQLETLNRDLENVRSSAEITRRAGELGMALPTQPGILAVRENGEIVEERPAESETSPVIDVNGAPVRPGQASSDPEATTELGESLQAIPQGLQLPAPAAAPAPAAEAGVAPYAPNVPAAVEAPAAAPAEAPAPAVNPETIDENLQAGENGQ